MKEERLYIVGYMASGKTTFGKALARRIGWEFLDLDEEIERLAGKSIPFYISEHGEDAFRVMESLALKRTSSRQRVVVSCGGGTPCWRDNMEFMTLHGQTLWLVASPERLAERILQAPGTRPLVDGKNGSELLDFIKAHLRQRQPFYCKASWRLNAEHLENEDEINQTIDDFLKSDIRIIK